MGNRKGAAHDQEAHRNHYPRTGTNLPLEGVKRALCLGRNFAAEFSITRRQNSS